MKSGSKNGISLLLMFLAFMLQTGIVSAAEPAAGKATAAVHFYSRDEARKALTEGEGKAYFDSLQLIEMKAKTGLALNALSLEEARVQTRHHYAESVMEFTSNERAALLSVTDHLRPLLAAKAPLYARTPWAFLKVSNHVEGGLPHTHSGYIVLAPSFLEPLAEVYKNGQLETLYAVASSLLVHEQTHVLERNHPALFASLFSDVFGFTHISPSPVTPELLKYGVVNPDGPDNEWAYPIQEGTHQQWVMPFLMITKDSGQPRMPDDFQTMGVYLEKNAGHWRVVNVDQHPLIKSLSEIPQYAGAFPYFEDFYHPNEIAANLFASWLTEPDVRNANPVLYTKVSGWAAQNFR